MVAKKEDRHELILSRIKKDRKISMVELASELNVSEHTIRRDLKELAEVGLLTTVRGGARVKSSMPFNIYDRDAIDVNQKNAIAEKSIELLQQDQVVFFDGGTTTQAIAGYIPDHMKLTVVTHSFLIANVLATHPNVKLIFAGGELCKSSFTTQGIQMINTFEKIYADICFLGICSIDDKKGITARTSEEADVKRIMCQNSSQIVAATTYNKLYTTEPFFVCPVTAIDYLITEKNSTDTELQPFINQGIQIL